MKIIVVRAAFAVALLIGLTVGLAGAASAHNVLISSDPADGSTIRAAPTEVEFTFDLPVQNFDPAISVTGPDGHQYQSGAAQINGNVVSSAVALGPAGGYIAAFRIVSADGHPVTGEIRFTLAGGASTATGSAGSAPSAAFSPGAGAAPTPTPVSASAQIAAPGSGLSAWLWIGLIVAAVLIGGAVVVLLRRPSRDG